MDFADLRKRAESSNRVAQTIMGTCYLDAIDVEVDLTEAFRLLSAAAKQGATRAMANLAYMYAEGFGTQKNIFEALQLCFLKDCREGD
jgi:TPR repeat protein